MLSRDELHERINLVMNDHKTRLSRDGGYPWFFRGDLFDRKMADDGELMSELYAILKDHFVIRKGKKKDD